MECEYMNKEWYWIEDSDQTVCFSESRAGRHGDLRDDGTVQHYNACLGGTVNSEPPMLSVSVRKERYSHDIIKNDGVFAVNLVSEELVRATDYCGVKSCEKSINFPSCTWRSSGEKTGAPLDCGITRISGMRRERGAGAGITRSVPGGNRKCRCGPNSFWRNWRNWSEKSKPCRYSHGEYYALGRFSGILRVFRSRSRRSE